MTKAELRKIYIQRRNLLQPLECDSFSHDIANQFSRLPLQKVKFLHLFYPIPGRKEVDCLIMADFIRQEHPQVKLVLSKIKAADHSLDHILWEPGTPLAMNSWRITEPVTGEEVRPDQLDMILVPLLAFDRTGNRVGYGKGFYDRFLSSCRQDAVKAGVSFFSAEQMITDTDHTDIPLDMCITPKQVYTFSRHS